MLMANQIGERGLQLDDDHLGLVTMTAKVIDAKHFWSDDGQYHKFPTKSDWQYQLSLISLFPSDGFNPQMRPELSSSSKYQKMSLLLVVFTLMMKIRSK